MTSRRTAKHSRRKNLFALAVGVLIGFLLCEVMVRALPHRWVPELSPVQPATIYLGGMAQKSANPRLYYELTPGRGDVNEAGYRGRDYPETKPPGVKRIVGVGNSTLFGSGVADKDNYLRQLEGLLNKTDSVQVINLAVPGYNTHQELEMLRSHGFGFDPDLVILGYDHNDPRPILGRRRPPMPDEYGQNIFRSEFIRYLFRKFYSRPQIRFRRKVDGYLAGGKGWDHHFEALAEIAGESGKRDIPVLVVVYDATIEREDRAKSRHYRLLHQPFASFWKEHGFFVLDCYDLAQTYMRDENRDNLEPLWVSSEPRDAHPNRTGHERIAHAVHDLIKENQLLR